MKLPRRPLARVIALTTSAVLVGGAAAVADTVPVTHSVVNGLRALTVTGSNGTAPVAGPPSLAFNGATASAPFGVVVSDVLYERKGYSVDATLSNLYRLEATGINCNASIPSGAFNVTFDALPTPGDVQAVLDTALTFVDTNTKEDLLLADPTLSSVLSAISGDMPVTVSSVKGVVQELSVPTLANPLMTVGNGTPAAFTAQAAHPGCSGSGAGSPSSVALQTGTKNDPTAAELATLKGDVFGDADGDTSSTLTVAEAMTAGLLPAGADGPGGVLYEATKTAVKTVIDAESTLAGLVSTTELDATTVLVIEDLRATATDLVLNLIGQTGVYANLPRLNLDASKDGDPTTGTYHGIMTVTLTDGS